MGHSDKKRGRVTMLEDVFNKLKEEKDWDKQKQINQMQYIMNYGEYTVRFEFFLN